MYAVMPKADYQDACDAVREKTGKPGVIKSGDMGAQIRSIDTREDLSAEMAAQDDLIAQIATALEGKSAGGGDSVENPIVIEPLTITENGTYTAPDGVNGYSPITVNVESSGGEDEWYITDARYLFYYGARLDIMDDILPKLKDVTVMSSMFNGCLNLTNVDVSKWDTSKVTSMQDMFNYCLNLTNVDVSKWDTSKVTSMNGMFCNCSKLTRLDVSGWDTSKVTNMGNMLYNCTALTELIGFSATCKAGMTIQFPYGSGSSSRCALKRLTFRTDLPEGVYSIRSAIRISYCDFDRAGMVEMFNTLPDVSGLGLIYSYTTITITGNPCVTDGSLTAEDEAIATSKGWTLVK